MSSESVERSGSPTVSGAGYADTAASLDAAANESAPTRPRRAVRGRRRGTRGRWSSVGFNVIGLVVAAVLVFPVYWMVTTAFKSGENVLSFVPQWFPTHPTLSHFAEAIDREHFLSSVLNSIIVVGSAVLAASLLGFLAAVAVARFRFYGRRAFLLAVIMVQMVPLNALVIPLYLTLNSVGQTNKLTGVIVTYLTFVLPFTVWTLRGFVINVPADLEEAAMVDGCSRVGAFVRILLPLVAPGLVATSVYAFITAWNEYLLAYVLLADPDKQTVTVWLAGFTTTKGTDWGPLMAGATLTAIPVVVFFLLVHKRVATGLTAGAVKG